MKNNFFNKHASHRLACLKKRHGGILLFFAVFLSFELAIRTALLVKAAQDVSWDLSLLAVFGWGIVYDLGAACWFSIPLVVLLTILPERFFERPWGRLSMHAIVFPVIFLLLFGLAAEWVFWDEFGVRFNFIAVDYLVYTQEVVENILESYPIPLSSAVSKGPAERLFLKTRSPESVYQPVVPTGGRGLQGWLPCWERCQIVPWHIVFSSDKEGLRKSHNQRSRVTAYESGWRTHPTEQFFDNLTFVFDSKASPLLHGKILSPVLRGFGSCQLL